MRAPDAAAVAPTQRPPQRRLLRRKLLMIVMVATCAALLLSAASLLSYELHSFRRAVVTDMQTQAELLAQSIAPTLLFDDRKAAASALAALKLRPNVLAAAVYASDGTLFASYEATASVTPAAVPPGKVDDVRFNGQQLDLAHRIVGEGETLGTLVIRAEHQMAPRITSYLLILLATSAAGLGVAWLIYRRLHPSITVPLLAVAQAAHRVTHERDFNVRVHATSDDEVGTLVEAFNGMLDQLSIEMKERQAAESALRDADRRKDEFLATLAHELRNPLAPLRNGLEILRHADDDPALRQRTRVVMDRQLTHMVRLIDDLLDMSRITRGRLELRLATVDSVAVARQAVDAVQAAIDAKRHTLHVRWPDAPLWVCADSARLTQVLINLLSNAAKYTPEGGNISLALESREGSVRITVEDDGIGIAAEHQAAIFDMFVQVDRSLERGLTGLGIGLTITKQLVHLHGGTIGVDSAGPGKGATFVVQLSAVQAPRAVASEPVRESGAGTAKSLDVLIADDNVDFAESFAALLEPQGHRVRVCHDGPAALAAIVEAPPDVAFLDIGLPGMNGYRLAEQVRGLDSARGLLLVAVTGWAQESDRRQATQSGYDFHWVKPIEMAQAIDFLANVEPRSARMRAAEGIARQDG